MVTKDRKSPCCKDCKFLRELWWWKNYPKGKKYGYCCVMLERTEADGPVVQLYDNIDDDRCEMFAPKDNENNLSQEKV